MSKESRFPCGLRLIRECVCDVPMLVMTDFEDRGVLPSDDAQHRCRRCRPAVHTARLIAPQVSGGPPSRVENRGGGTPIFNPGRLSRCLTAVLTG